MSVSVTRSGGFAGFAGKTRSVKLADLPAEKAALVTSLAESVASSASPGNLAARDAFRYEFRIEHETGTTEFEVTETAMSPDQRRLAQLVAEI